MEDYQTSKSSWPDEEHDATELQTSYDRSQTSWLLNGPHRYR